MSLKFNHIPSEPTDGNTEVSVEPTPRRCGIRFHEDEAIGMYRTEASWSWHASSGREAGYHRLGDDFSGVTTTWRRVILRRWYMISCVTGEKLFLTQEQFVQDSAAFTKNHDCGWSSGNYFLGKGLLKLLSGASWFEKHQLPDLRAPEYQTMEEFQSDYANTSSKCDERDAGLSPAAAGVSILTVNIPLGDTKPTPVEPDSGSDDSAEEGSTPQTSSEDAESSQPLTENPIPSGEDEGSLTGHKYDEIVEYANMRDNYIIQLLLDKDSYKNWDKAKDCLPLVMAVMGYSDPESAMNAVGVINIMAHGTHSFFSPSGWSGTVGELLQYFPYLEIPASWDINDKVEFRGAIPSDQVDTSKVLRVNVPEDETISVDGITPEMWRFVEIAVHRTTQDHYWVKDGVIYYEDPW